MRNSNIYGTMSSRYIEIFKHKFQHEQYKIFENNIIQQHFKNLAFESLKHEA